jgi:hypothetical protein
VKMEMSSSFQRLNSIVASHINCQFSLMFELIIIKNNDGTSRSTQAIK